LGGEKELTRGGEGWTKPQGIKTRHQKRPNGSQAVKTSLCVSRTRREEESEGGGWKTTFH